MWWATGVPFQLFPPPLLLFTNVSRTGWEVHLQNLTAAGTWTEEEDNCHVSVLEIKAVQLA